MPEVPDVRPGQVWADNDHRSAGRHITVVAIEPATPGRPHHRAVPARAVVTRCTPDGRTWSGTSHTRIKLDRFRPTSTGYRLVKDAPGGTP